MYITVIIARSSDTKNSLEFYPVKTISCTNTTSDKLCHSSAINRLSCLPSQGDLNWYNDSLIPQLFSLVQELDIFYLKLTNRDKVSNCIRKPLQELIIVIRVSSHSIGVTVCKHIEPRYDVVNYNRYDRYLPKT